MADTLSNQAVVEEIESLESIPEEYTPGLGALYPGTYVFRTPGSFKDLFQPYKSKYGKPNEDKVEREFVRLSFKGDAALTVIAAPPDGQDRVGTPFNTQISNQPRARGKDKIMISDLTYLYKALGGTIKFSTNASVAVEMSKHAGKAFKANVEYTGFCNPQRQAYVQQDGRSVPSVDANNNPVNGCGERIYGNNWPKQDGKFAPVVGCSKCGASIRPFNGLNGFGAAPNA